MAINTRWTLEKIKEGFEKFHKEHGRYPTSLEIDAYQFLPSSRQIQRAFGGLPAIRAELKLKGPQDFTKGDHSSNRAHSINKRAHEVEKEVYDYLIKRFGKPFVHREFFYSDDRRNRTDFHVYTKSGNFMVDVFFPKDKHNMAGCLNSKMRTFGNLVVFNTPVIFLMMNDEIKEEAIEKLLKNKTNKLQSYQHVYTYKQFKSYCEGKAPLKSS